MAQTGYTPIQLYRTATASASPIAGNLSDGELAINTNDGKLFYKDSGGTVQVIASKGAGTVGGFNTYVQYNNNGVLGGSANFVFDGNNVGIGTTSSSYSLEVRRDAASATTFSAIRNATASGAYGVAFLGIIGTVGSNYYQLSQSGSGDTALTNANAGNLLFGTNNTERMRIDSSGNVGIGTSSPAYKLHVQANTANYDGMRLVNASSSASAVTLLQIGNDTNAAAAALELNSSANSSNYGGVNALVLRNGLAYPIVFATAGSERMRIDSSGNLLVGVTSAYSVGGTANGLFLGNTQSLYFSYSGYNSWRYTPYLGDLYWNNGPDRMKLSAAGALQTTTGTISALSDVNYKDNIIDAPDYLSLLNQVRVRKFSYKEENASTQTHIGVIAQELETVLPEMVSLSNSSDGTEEYKVVRYTDFTMMLIKAIQELSAEVTALKAKVGA